MNPNEKARMKEIIMISLGNICSGDYQTCHWGECGYREQCVKEIFLEHGITNKKIGLKGLIKRINSVYNKRKGRESPHYLGHNVFKIAETLLGCPIEEHELIKPYPDIIKQINSCTTLNQMIVILKRQKTAISFNPSK